MRTNMPWYEVVSEISARGEAYVLVTVLGARGSTPRDSGTKMVICLEGGHGTIGGGHLEHRAFDIAAEMLELGEARQRLEHFPLGPSLGQCCGGRTSLLFESFPATHWHIALFGAGHVGHQLTKILAELPCRLTWVDSRAEALPDELPANTRAVVSQQPEDEVADLPAGTSYVVMTHSHPMDFAITEAILARGDAHYVGLIGSDTKWRRFQMRFRHRGHADDFFAPVHCPIGLPGVGGKLPAEIAVAVAAELIVENQREQIPVPTAQGIDWRELATTELTDT